jgi:hypothetical protein
MDEYFVKRTDERLDRMEIKIDMILQKYWVLVGMATAASAVITLALNFLLK